MVLGNGIITEGIRRCRSWGAAAGQLFAAATQFKIIRKFLDRLIRRLLDCGLNMNRPVSRLANKIQVDLFLRKANYTFLHPSTMKKLSS